MDNQASRQIKQFLTQHECNLILVELHNHHVNATKRAIQTFKDHLLVPLPQQTVSFLSNSGIASLHKSKHC
jgi:hypothetical protein